MKVAKLYNKEKKAVKEIEVKPLDINSTCLITSGIIPTI